MVKVWTKCIPVLLFTSSSTSAGETRLSSFMLFEVWPSGWTSLLSPPPPQRRPIPASRRTHLKGFAFRADTRRRLARWKHSASGLPYQWRQCCVTHRERTSCFTTLLLFLLQTAAIALSFFSPPLPPLQFCFVAVRKRCGAGQWSTPSDSFVPRWTHLGLFSLFAFCCLFFSWFSLVAVIDTCSAAIMDIVTRILSLWGQWWIVLLLLFTLYLFCCFLLVETNGFLRSLRSLNQYFCM